MAASVIRAAPGQAVVELALIITMLLVMSIAVFEFGGMLQTHNVVVQAAREGARFGMNIVATDAQIEAAARAAAGQTPLNAGNVGPTAGVEISHPSATELRVTTRATFTSDAVGILLPAIGRNITISSSMDTRRW